MRRAIYVLIALILLIGIYFVIVPLFGVPNSEQIIKTRIGRLEEWKQAVTLYNQDLNLQANNLFDVFNYYKKKTGRDLKLVILNYGDNEISLIRDERILNNRDAFIEKIDYEIVNMERNWYVKEKRPYTRFFKKLMMIDQDGNISTMENS